MANNKYFGFVSIILVNWNGEKWLGKCLESLVKQTYRNYEIILVDNASDDESVKFVNQNYSKVKIIKSEKNLGFAGGNNLGIDNAKGEFILLINTDTWIEPDFLTRIIRFYNEHDYDVISPREASYNGKKRLQYSMLTDLFGHSFGILNSNAQSFYLSGVCLLFSKKLYRETKGLDNNFFMYCEEVDWFWRLRLLKKKFTYVDNIFVYHAGAGSTGKGIKYNIFLWRNQNTLQMILKNYSLVNLIWVLPLYFTQNIFEIVFFLLISKPRIAYTYVEGWTFNVKKLKRIFNERKWVQENRLIDDFTIMKKMYFGSGKLRHLINYIR